MSFYAILLQSIVKSGDHGLNVSFLYRSLGSRCLENRGARECRQISALIVFVMSLSVSYGIRQIVMTYKPCSVRIALNGISVESRLFTVLGCRCLT